MDKFNFEFFEFVGAAIPGIPIFILASFFITSTPFSFDALILALKTVSIAEASVALLACYCIGFCLHYPAYEAFQPLVTLWGEKRTKGLPISIGKREKELVAIRHKSPDNFKLISKFLALRQMSYTMFFSLTVCFFVLLFVLIIMTGSNRSLWSGLLLTSIFGFLFLRRAVAFHQRIQEMITESSKMP
jgi:hypothetical protein